MVVVLMNLLYKDILQKNVKVSVYDLVLNRNVIIQ